MFFRHKLSPQVYYELILKGVRTFRDEGWRSFWFKFNSYRNSRKLLKKSKIAVPTLHIPTLGADEALEVIHKKVSLIIPTKNAGPEFEFTLQKIAQQKGIEEIELIVVDSGSHDGTAELAGNYGAKIYNIKPEAFNHGETRNWGAEKAGGDYILFMVQDAIPIGTYWLYQVVKVLESDGQIAAVTCRQVPRSDADLFACWSLWNFYKSLDLQTDKILQLDSGTDFENLLTPQKRRLTQLDNVCACYKKEVFEHFRFKRLSYAEDLELGVRLIKNNYKLAFLYSVGVIHSHNRPPSYTLKRNFVSEKIVSRILRSPDRAYKPGWEETGLEINVLYRALNAAAYKINRMPAAELDKAFAVVNGEINKKSKAEFFRAEESFPQEPTLAAIWGQLEKSISMDLSAEKLKMNGRLLDDYHTALKDFELYMFLTHDSLQDKREDFIAALYHLFAAVTGTGLGKLYFQADGNKNQDEKLIKIDELLSQGV